MSSRNGPANARPSTVNGQLRAATGHTVWEGTQRQNSEQGRCGPVSVMLPKGHDLRGMFIVATVLSINLPLF